MSARAFAAQARRLRALRSEVCLHAQTGAYTWALLLEFRARHSPGERERSRAEHCLVVECPWRLETPTSVLVASADGEAIESDIQVCVGKQVLSVTVYRPSFMARLRFSDGLTLWLFPERTAEYAPNPENPSVSWYLTGRGIPSGWEE